jgi:hypothetical protein
MCTPHVPAHSHIPTAPLHAFNILYVLLHTRPVRQELKTSSIHFNLVNFKDGCERLITLVYDKQITNQFDGSLISLSLFLANVQSVSYANTHHSMSMLNGKRLLVFMACLYQPKEPVHHASIVSIIVHQQIWSMMAVCITFVIDCITFVMDCMTFVSRANTPKYNDI